MASSPFVKASAPARASRSMRWLRLAPAFGVGLDDVRGVQDLRRFRAVLRGLGPIDGGGFVLGLGVALGATPADAQVGNSSGVVRLVLAQGFRPRKDAVGVQAPRQDGGAFCALPALAWSACARPFLLFQGYGQDVDVWGLFVVVPHGLEDVRGAEGRAGVLHAAAGPVVPLVRGRGSEP
jgi:hypothetical protein